MNDDVAGLHGAFEADRERYRMGDPIVLTLELRNDGDRDLYLFVPRGRADGVTFEVIGGFESNGYVVTGLEGEPEAGLTGETTLAPGSAIRQRYPLSDWLAFKRPGSYVIRVEAEVTVASSGLGRTDIEHRTGQSTITTEIVLEIEAAGS